MTSENRNLKILRIINFLPWLFFLGSSVSMAVRFLNEFVSAAPSAVTFVPIASMVFAGCIIFGIGFFGPNLTDSLARKLFGKKLWFNGTISSSLRYEIKALSCWILMTSVCQFGIGLGAFVHAAYGGIPFFILSLLGFTLKNPLKIVPLYSN